MSELYLVRHAQASFGAGDYDLLSELGHRQARWLGEHFGFRELSFDRVICGDMARHRETAEGILRGMGLEPTAYETEPAWNEFDFEAIIDAFLKQLFELLRASSGAEYSSVQQLVFCDGEIRLAGLVLLFLACPVGVLRYLIVSVPVSVVRVRLGR